jgi:uncharacterized protein YndB with AHSA1/START domain
MTDEQQPSGARATLQTPADREIVTERLFAASRERVFAAFTQPELVARWWGLRDDETIVDALDLRVGGAWRFVERKGDGTEQAFRGIYREVTPPERLVYTFEWEGMPGHVLIDTATFEERGAATNVRIHSLFHTSGERDGLLSAGMERGLNESYDSLDLLLRDSG